MCNTLACLQFDHSQRFESTTDRFALQLYGKFNWKYGQIGLLCSLCHLRSNMGIISGLGSFAVRDHLRSWDHLRTRTGFVKLRFKL